MNLFSIFGVASASCEKTFLGLKTWYHYLDLNSDCRIQNFNILPHGSEKSDIPLILLAITDDLLRLAGIAAVIFVIVGAVGLITSDGNPDQAAKARSTIINALLGLAITVVAIAFVAFLASQLGGK